MTNTISFSSCKVSWRNFCSILRSSVTFAVLVHCANNSSTATLVASTVVIQCKSAMAFSWSSFMAGDT